MRFAIIGDAPPALALARAIVASATHELVATIDAAGLVEELGRVCSFRILQSWEDLVTTCPIDAAVLAGGQETDAAAARRLADAGCRLLVVPGIPLAATLAYELSLVQADRPASLFPLFALRGHPLVCRLRATRSLGASASPQHVLLERREPSSAGVLRAEQIHRALAADSDLLRALFGEFDQVMASQANDGAGEISMFTATLAAAHRPQVIWSAVAGGKRSWTLKIVGARGTTVLAGDPNEGRLSLTDQTGQCQTAHFDAGAWLLDAFDRAIARVEPIDASGGETALAQLALPDWHDLVRCADLLEAVDRSIRRKRTVDLSFDLPSERGTFKTQMTAAGCGLLVVTLGLVVAYLTVSALFDLPDGVNRALVVLIFLPLGVFLAMQGLFFVARPAETRARGER